MRTRFEFRTVCRHFDAQLLKGKGGIVDLILDGTVLEYRRLAGELCEQGVCAVLRDGAEQVYHLTGRLCGLRRWVFLCFRRGGCFGLGLRHLNRRLQRWFLCLQLFGQDFLTYDACWFGCFCCCRCSRITEIHRRSTEAAK